MFYEIEQDFQILADAIENPNENLTTQEIEELKKYLQEKLVTETDLVFKILANRKYKIEAIENEIKELTEIKNTEKRKVENFKEFILDFMSSTGKKELDGTIKKIILSKTSSINVTDETKLNDKYIAQKITYSADLKAIKEDIKNGIVVEGADQITRQFIKIYNTGSKTK